MSFLPIYLIGFMASGKSSKGKKLAKRLELEFVDLDKEIEKKEGETVSEIFAKKGEAYFRQLETEILQSYKKSEKKLIALGGGAVCHSNNINLVKETGTSVYLKLSNERLLGRLRQKRKNRPLIAHLNNEELKLFIDERMQERKVFYEQADVIIDAEALNIEEILKQIKIEQ